MARKSAKHANDDVVIEAQKRRKQAESWESLARANFKEDILFATGDSYNNNQWPQAVLGMRQPRNGVSRPCLTFNKIQQHNKQIANSARQNQMGIKVNATGFGATSEAADGIEGLIRHIEYQSNAQQNAYACAIDFQIKAGIGWTHIVSDFAPGDTFDQELYIRSVPDPLKVYSDPDCQEPDHSDMRWAQISEDMPRAEFEAKYPASKDLAGVQPLSGDGKDYSRGWVDKDTVRVVRYYRLNEVDDTLYAVPPNTMLPAPMSDDGQPAVDPLTGQPMGPIPVPAGPMRKSKMPDDLVDMASDQDWQSRPIADSQVEWFLIAGHEVIDQGETVFDHIPLVPWLGEEIVIEGKMDRWGQTRLMIDAQRMLNYNASAEVEFVALQTKAPWLGDARSFEGYEEQWANANIGLASFLPVNTTDPDTGLPIPMPERVNPPTGSAFMQGMANAEHQMQLVSGQYDAEMGAPGNERTGVAIQQRQRQGDTATYHFTDMQGAALRLTGVILIGAISKTYDTQRAIQILGLDGQRTGMVVDPSLPTAHQEVPPPPPGTPQPPGAPPVDPDAEAIMAINPTVGRYDVEADVGPAYGTRRQEAFAAITQILGSAPELTGKIGDLLFKAADFPFADKIAERLAPPGEDPQAAAAQQQIQQLHAQLGALQQKLNDKQADQQIRIGQQQHDKVDDVMKSEIDRYKAETDRIAAIGSIDPAMLMPLVQQAVRDALATQIGGGAAGPLPQLPQPQQPPPSLAPPAGPIGTPQGTDVQRLPTTNPPGGLVHVPVPSNGAVQ